MSKQEVAFEFQKSLKPLVAEQFLTSDGADQVLRLFLQHLDNYAEDLTSEIESQIKEWELRLPDDDSLYSLGMRHALDILTEQDPNRFRAESTVIEAEISRTPKSDFDEDEATDSDSGNE